MRGRREEGVAWYLLGKICICICTCNALLTMVRLHAFIGNRGINRVIMMIMKFHTALSYINR